MKFEFNNMNNANEQPNDLNAGETVEKSLENENEDQTEDIFEAEVEAWDKLSEEEKLAEIEKRKNKISDFAEKFGFDMKKNVEEIREELKGKYEAYAKMEEDLNKVHSGDPEAGEGLEEMKRVLSSLCGIYESQLQIDYLEYLEKYEEDLKDPELLLKSHAKRNLIMKNWETLVGNMRADLSKTGEEEEETMRGWAKWVKEHPEISLAVLLALIAAGVAIAMLSATEMGGAGATAVSVPAIKGGAGIVVKMFSGAGAVAGAGAGMLVGGGIVGKALSWISKEENRDKTAFWLSGIKDFPGWYYSLGGKRAKPSDSK